MVFNSITFLIFFIAFYLIYWFLNNKSTIRKRNIFVLLASYFFYGYWDWRFLSLIFISSLVDYILGLKISTAPNSSKRKLYLTGSIIANMGILGFFKYFNFFIESLQQALSLFAIELQTSTLQIILPVGISFYTFQTLSYTIDIYRGKMEPTRDFVKFFAFVSFFPQLVAGPIERASNLMQQFENRKVFDNNNQVIGLRHVLYGLFKKVVIADNLGLIADSIFDPGLSHNGLTVFLGSMIFGVQIYCDFSGYSDMAIGLAKMLNIDLMKNFNTPYYSGSFTEFWRRWHISLSTWFRDYVYIPLGGNKCSTARVNFNIMLTFLLSGLWHGARITFLIWGALHGLMLLIEKNFPSRISKKIAAPLVFVLTSLFWIPFRAQSFVHLKSLVISLFSFGYSWSEIFNIVLTVHSTSKVYALGLILLLFILIERIIAANDFNHWIKNKSTAVRYLAYYSLFISVLLLGNINIDPFFIYFQF